MAHGNFVWNELVAHDVAKAKTFYAETRSSPCNLPM